MLAFSITVIVVLGLGIFGVIQCRNYVRNYYIRESERVSKMLEDSICLGRRLTDDEVKEHENKKFEPASVEDVASFIRKF